MAQPVRPRRSVLYMPGSNARALEKAKSLPADALILDLEDAVAPDAKVAARDQVVGAVEQGSYGPREVVIRVNGSGTPWHADDLAAAAASRAEAVLLPKVEGAGQVRAAAAALPEGMDLWCMIETPLAILHAEEIAAASPAVRCLVMGTSDLATDLNALHTPRREPFLTSLSLCLLAARAYGLAALDGVYLDLENDDGFEAACHQGRDLGFDGKTLIHPRQVEPANRVFAPSNQDITEADIIVTAFEQAQAEGKGVVVVNGQLVENLHVAAARRLLALADAITARQEGA
ncbi:MAG: CoA ester lyase [Alphaproteobacteria bacterium]|jgi:citrate lyase subunit beta/citryl-CoA lyase|nr:CoA ester lyase [Alphaproteobacteria bacterium]MDP6565621.1 CoA ester lyase [Alphaproteobacteria bacterium]MDP6813236.1 CoA ester lyase [Alphaproteobacteria bacterium]